MKTLVERRGSLCVRIDRSTKPSLTTVAADPSPMAEVMSNVASIYAIEAVYGIAKLYTEGLCANFNQTKSRFQDTGLATSVLQRLLCETCSDDGTSNASILVQQIKLHRTNIFHAQLNSALGNNTPAWRILCTQFDSPALTRMLGTDAPRELACSRASLPPPPDPRPEDVQPDAAGFGFDRMPDLRGVLLGRTARASFATTEALRAACGGIQRGGDAWTRVAELEDAPGAFVKGMCGPGNKYEVVGAEELRDGVVSSMANIFVQTMWLAGSSKVYRAMVCSGHKDGRLANFDANGLLEVGLDEVDVDPSMSARCSAAGV